MSYIQGTQVKLKGHFDDKTTGQPIDPTEVILTVEDPIGGVVQYTFSGDQVQKGDDTGDFYYILDTSPLPGAWKYQFESTGTEKVVGRQQITVRPRIATPA